MMANCNVATKVSYFVAGLGIGAAVALLFAPQSGEDTRKQIAEKAQEGTDFVASKSREIRKQAEDIVDQGKDLVSKQKARLADALESGKQTVRETFSR
jgi:gas vesicle protein